MRYILAVIVPPLAVLLCGKPFSAVINGVLWGVGIVGLMAFGLGAILMIACAIHAIMTVSGHKADKRTDRLIKAIGKTQQPQRA